jgi:hypothetical protein
MRSSAELNVNPAKGMQRSQALFIGIHSLTLLCAAAQIFIDASQVNAVAALCVALSAAVTFGYLQLSRALEEVPLSSFALAGLCVTTQWGALLGQTVFWESMTVSLRAPTATFTYLLMFQLVAVSAHWVWRHLGFLVATRQLITEHVLAPLGIFGVPRVQALWAIGILGLLSIVVTGGGQVDLIRKIVDTFNFLSWAPFAIPLLHRRFGKAYCDMRKHWVGLAAFGFCAVLLGMALNYRAVMFVGALTALLLGLLHLTTDKTPLRAKHFVSLGVAALIAVLLFEPLTYFTAAIQVARDQRDRIGKLEMVAHTLKVLQDPAAVRRARDRIEISPGLDTYDEYYFRSSMIGRFVETKFHDNMFFMIEGASALESRLIADDAIDRIWSILPYPLLKSMGLERAKTVSLYSLGDYLTYLRLGGESAFRTGSMFAQAVAIFGAWAPLLYFLLCIPLFMVWDVLSRRDASAGTTVLSVVAMLLMYRLFAYGLVTESFSGLIALLARNQLQNVMVFALVFALSRLIWPPFEHHAESLAERKRARVLGVPGAKVDLQATQPHVTQQAV